MGDGRSQKWRSSPQKKRAPLPEGLAGPCSNDRSDVSVILAEICSIGQDPIVATKAVGQRDEALRQQRTSFTEASSRHAHRPMVLLRMQPMASPTQCRLSLRSQPDRAIQQCGKCIPRPTRKLECRSRSSRVTWIEARPAPCDCAIRYRGARGELKSTIHFFRLGFFGSAFSGPTAMPYRSIVRGVATLPSAVSSQRLIVLRG